MKLTYRGHSYEISTPSQIGIAVDSAKQPQTKLTYRGQTYCATPRSAVPAAAPEASTVVTLSYRGVTYQRILSSPKLYDFARLTHWRYQAG